MSAETLIEQLERQRRKVDFYTYDFTVQYLITLVESGELDVAPAYQRKFRWDNSRRAALIESVFLGLPIPSLFVATNKDGTWELVDGVQRISTLVQFAGTRAARERLELTEPLTIVGARKLPALNGLQFEQLPSSLKSQVEMHPLKVVALSDKNNMTVRFDLFECLNTGSVALTNQEIRSCVYRGEFSHFLEDLAGNSAEFRHLLRLTDAQEKDGTRIECVLRFFAFLNRYKSFDRSVNEFLNEYMKIASKSFHYSASRRLFTRTFEELSGAFSHGIIRDDSRRKTTPIMLFEAVAVGASLALKEQPKLHTKRVQEWVNSQELKRLTVARHSQDMIVARIEYCRDRFLGK